MTFEWQVPLLVAAIVVALLYFSGRATLPKRRQEPPTNGAELIERLQKTLGIAIAVESVEAPEPSGSSEPDDPDVAGPTAVPHTIRATLMFGRYTAPVVASGPTESDAWAELARIAIAWRKSDYQNVPMWGGGA